MKSLSIVIPALNEEKYLGETLERVKEAVKELEGSSSCPMVQIIVVDNGSTDRTADVARSFGAIVVPESERNIGKARNVGARAAEGEVVLFLDADTLIPPALLSRIVEIMSDPLCDGGAVETDHQPKSSILRVYFWFWRMASRLSAMAQGAAQFYRREAFLEMGGYDEKIFMGEDVECYWDMNRAAKKRGHKLHFIKELKVVPSPRRFDIWPLWRTLVYTNPALILLRRRSQRAWRGWYESAPR